MSIVSVVFCEGIYENSTKLDNNTHEEVYLVCVGFDFLGQDYSIGTGEHHRHKKNHKNTNNSQVPRYVMLKLTRLIILTIYPRINNLTIPSNKNTYQPNTNPQSLLKIYLDSIDKIINNKNKDECAAVNGVDYG